MNIFSNGYQLCKNRLSELKRIFSSLHFILLMALLVVIVGGICLFSTFNQEEKSYELTGVAMGSYVKQTVYSNNGQAICDEAMRQIMKLENFISWDKKGSDISNLNQTAGGIGWTDVNDTTLSILSSCKNMYEKSNGAFDPTMLSVSSLWNFRDQNHHVPLVSEVSEALKHVNGKALQINSDLNRVKIFDRGVGVDLTPVENGGACKIAVESYRKLKADRAIVAVGGSIGVYGSKKNGKPWNVALKNPFDNSEANKSFAILKVNSGFVTTVGLYDQSFTENEILYHSILDPRTGYPVNSNVVSASVWHDDGVIADMLSRLCFVLDSNSLLNLLSDFNAKAVIVKNDKSVYVSKEIQELLVITDKAFFLGTLD